jgi:hypothetical protein
MAAPNANTFDLSPPRRPTIADFNNASKQDDPNNPPNIATMPNSGEWNTMAFLLVALGQSIPTARVSVDASASPSIASVIGPGTAVNGKTSAFVLTRVGAGEYWVECATSALLPTAGSQPSAYLNSATAIASASASATYGTGPSLGNPAVLVLTDIGGSLADCNFTVDFF